MKTPILDSVEYDINAQSVYSKYDRETNRKLDTLFASWAFEDNRAESFNYERGDINDAADAAKALLLRAEEEAQSVLIAEAMAAEAEIEAATLDASIYGQGA